MPNPDIDAEPAAAASAAAPDLSPELERLARHIRQWRVITGTTRKQLSEQAGISVGAIVRLEAGISTNITTLFAICRVLGLTEGLFDALDPARTALGQEREHLLDRRRAHPFKD